MKTRDITHHTTRKSALKGLEDAKAQAGRGYPVGATFEIVEIDPTTPTRYWTVRMTYCTDSLDVIERYGAFIKACGTTSDGVRVLKGEIAPPAGWEDFVATSQARRESER